MTKILVVEDDKNIQSSIVDMLELAQYDVICANDGAIGLQQALSVSPDLIISDVMMPNMDGYELFQAVKGDRRTTHIPFIFLTALTSYNDVRRGMGLGADDYLKKPFNYEQLITAVNSRLEKYAEMREIELRFHQELEIARTVQESIQPSETPQIHTLDLGYYWHPAYAVGGDAWGWVSTSSSNLMIFILDIAGKGLSAALAAMSLHTAIRLTLKLGLDPSETLQKINEEFYDTYTRSSIFATVTIISIDTESGVITQANAGHPPTLIHHHNDRLRWSQLDATSPPIGVLPDIAPENQILQLKPNDSIICYSDGFSEIETANGLWSIEGLQKATPREAYNAQFMVDAIVGTANDLQTQFTMRDDQTIIAVTYNV